MNTELVNVFSRTSVIAADSLLFRLWFDNSRANCCQSRLTARARARYSVQFEVTCRIIDTGLPAKDRKWYLLSYDSTKNCSLHYRSGGSGSTTSTFVGLKICDSRSKSHIFKILVEPIIPHSFRRRCTGQLRILNLMLFFRGRNHTPS